MVALILFLVLVLADTTCSSSTSSNKLQHLLACDLVDYLRGETRSNRTNSGITDLNDGSISSAVDTCRHGHDVCGSRGRVVVIGDVHGSYEGLLELLYYSNITASEKSCQWREQTFAGTILVQVGDLVDRGSQSWETYTCLKQLQDTASRVHSRVIRLLGNHDMWWLEGRTHMKHKDDKRSLVRRVVAAMVGDILNGSLVAAYLHTIGDVPILFTHAGVGSKFYGFMQTQLQSSERSQLSRVARPIDPKQIEKYANDLLVHSIEGCRDKFPCRFSAGIELFSAGPDRGGTGLGGPFWTDFSLLEENAIQGGQPSHFLQVVGHTMAYCYDSHQPGRHPPLDQSECSDGLIRASAGLQSICVDGGLYLGGRAFLEIGSDGHMRAFQRYLRPKVISSIHGPYFAMDLTELTCTV